MEKYDVLIILGYPIQSKDDILQKRLAKALSYAKQYTIQNLIVSGKGRADEIEADYMAKWLQDHGYKGRIMKETQSRDTIENLLFSNEICKAKNLTKKKIVTSWFHVPRTKLLSSKLIGKASLLSASGGSLPLALNEVGFTFLALLGSKEKWLKERDLSAKLQEFYEQQRLK